MTEPTPAPETRTCPRCAGCGQLANDDEQSPWKYWEELPPGADLAVKLGLVRPEPCPDCRGTGRREGAEMTPSEVLGHLIRFIEDPEDVAMMTPEEIRAELETEGIDFTAGLARLHERLAAIRENRQE